MGDGVIITNKPTAAHAKTVVAWNRLYLDTSVVAAEEDVFFFIDEKLGTCIGYIELSVTNHLFIEWFCAPKNGSRCMAALLRELPRLYPHCRLIRLQVSCSQTEDPKATPARLNLYYAFGFRITQSAWSTSGLCMMEMQRLVN